MTVLGMTREDFKGVLHRFTKLDAAAALQDLGMPVVFSSQRREYLILRLVQTFG